MKIRTPNPQSIPLDFISFSVSLAAISDARKEVCLSDKTDKKIFHIVAGFWIFAYSTNDSWLFFALGCALS